MVSVMIKLNKQSVFACGMKQASKLCTICCMLFSLMLDVYYFTMSPKHINIMYLFKHAPIGLQISQNI